ncbi:spermidine synthase [Rothia terrae]|uniref:Fused MFS/spermidine synthase n=1 Tax=Rothia terrae TaxID=396015 RepID=A0A7H2BDZ7_9MICC|nr:fused MFS/spermidine synthase [Rothia terrae]QNV37893.1 fused MFS/spermidine synthase [Rothia terrae]
MAKRRRKPKKQQTPEHGPVEGTYQIDTGVAELIEDDYTPDGWVLEINGMESSHIVLGRPRELDFEYMRWLAAVIEPYVDTHLDAEKLRITHLGGGACSMARYLADVYPKSRNTVVELDGKLADYVREWFELPKAPLVKIRVGEARAVTESFAPQSRDIIIRDVFAGYITPEPLTTLEFTQIAASSLAENGLYIINCGDNRDLQGARAEAAAIAQVFPHTCIVADPAMLKGRRRGNIILAGSFSPLPLDGEVATAAIAKRLLGGGVPAQYKDDAWVRDFARSGKMRRDPAADLSAETAL